MSQLVVRILGPPYVEWDGGIYDIPRRKVRALFFRLALDLQPVAREHVAFLFWPNETDEVAHRDLSHLLTHLRCALPEPDALQCTADFLFLDPRRIWTDTHEFLRLLRCHHAQPSAAFLAESASLVRGSLLDGFTLNDSPEFEEWLTIERSVWEHRHLSVLNALEREKTKTDNIELTILARGMFDAPTTDTDLHRGLAAGRASWGDAESAGREEAGRREPGEMPLLGLDIRDHPV